MIRAKESIEITFKDEIYGEDIDIFLEPDGIDIYESEFTYRDFAIMIYSVLRELYGNQSFLNKTVKDILLDISGEYNYENAYKARRL